MVIEFDDGRGKVVGSRLSMRGKAFGVRLCLEEVVVERVPPRRKCWETVGEPRLLVIASYRMGFSIEDDGQACRVTVFIDYELPGRPPGRWLGSLFGRAYARWCTESMAGDAADNFGGKRSD